MGNTLDMNIIRNDHQARTQRLVDSCVPQISEITDDDQATCKIIELALRELATIWREEAQRLSDIVDAKPRGWKGTMESLRDCATRVMGVAVAMEKYGLPNSGDADPKASPEFADSPSLMTSPDTPISAGAANGNTTAPVHLSDDPAGDFLRDVGVDTGDWIKAIRTMDGFVTPEVAAQVRTEKEMREGTTVYMNSGGALDTNQPAMLTVEWSDNLSDAPTMGEIQAAASIMPGASPEDIVNAIKASKVQVLPEGRDVQIIP